MITMKVNLVLYANKLLLATLYHGTWDALRNLVLTHNANVWSIKAPSLWGAVLVYVGSSGRLIKENDEI